VPGQSEKFGIAGTAFVGQSVARENPALAPDGDLHPARLKAISGRDNCSFT
jgi:hypothetical protein